MNKNIAVVSGNLSYGFSSRLLLGIQSAAMRSGYDVFIYSVSEKEEVSSSEFFYEHIAKAKKRRLL
jgi:DNA-binding LacI/PurR family transcriptional regulator